MAGTKWNILLLQCVLAGRYAGGSGHTRRCSIICYGSEGREVSRGDMGRSNARHEATADLWQETYMSALLRAIRYADDASYRLAGFRKLDPITTPEAEVRFLKAAEALFQRGEWE